MVEQNKAVVRQYFEAFNAGQVDDYLALLDDDFRLCGMGMPDSGINHVMTSAQLAAIARGRSSAFREPMTITVDRLVAEGDSVVAFARSRATTASGQPYANQYAFDFALRGGRILSIREYCCTWSVVHVLRSDTGPGQ